MQHVLGRDRSSATVLVHDPQRLGPMGGGVTVNLIAPGVLRPTFPARRSGAGAGTGRAAGWKGQGQSFPRSMSIRAALDRRRVGVRPLRRGRIILFLHLPVVIHLPVGKGRDVVRAARAGTGALEHLVFVGGDGLQSQSVDRSI